MIRQVLLAAIILTAAGSISVAQNCGAIPNPAAVAGYTKQTVGGPISLGKNWQAIPGANVAKNSDGTITIKGGGSNYNNQIGSTQNISGGFYAEATLSWKGTARWAPGVDGWPAFWATNTQASLGMLNVEIDFMEAMSGNNSYGVGMHNWNKNGSDTNTGDGTVRATNFSKPNTYGFLLIPATANRQGSAQWFFNGRQVGKTITFGQSGLYSTLNTQSVKMLLGTGSNNPMTVYSASVWQAAGDGSGTDCGRAY